MNQVTKPPVPTPCVLGIVDAGMLAARRWSSSLWECGGVELRADGLLPEDVAAAVADFDAERTRRGFTGPVIFTLRLRRDGGAWDDAAAAGRNAVWQSLPPGTCDWADLEIEEAGRIEPETLDALRSSGVRILLSHHAFVPEEPSRWDEVLEQMQAFAPDGVKFAVALGGAETPANAVALLRLARRVAERYSSSCVLGMGGAGSLTRLVSPLLGCPWTYGFLGTTPAAPGQLRAEDMRRFFAAAAAGGTPGRDASEGEWLDWAATLWGKVSRAG